MSLQLALLETEEKVASNEIPSEEAETRLILDHLLIESQLYTSSKDYMELFDFAIRMRNLSPFNAMLVQIQKPGLIYVASAYDWQNRFERSVKNRARPLLILWPFGPIALVYDVDDTEGKELPDDVFSFLAKGSMTIERINSFIHNLQRKNFEWIWFDGGDADAGSIGLLHRSSGNKEYSRYRISVNKNHNSNQQFATLVHELGHLFLGHLGYDGKFKIQDRRGLTPAQKELEAESVSYIVCGRHQVISKAKTYLSQHVNEETKIKDFDIFSIMRAAGEVETLLGIKASTRFQIPPHKTKEFDILQGTFDLFKTEAILHTGTE